MSQRCACCNTVLPEGSERCPGCGAPASKCSPAGQAAPRTIDELKQWYADRNLPPYETTRFFIGINYLMPRAFGIYEENGIYTVYKNKNDGTRAVRYSGPDEARAVNELYEKLKSEIISQKENAAKRSNTSSEKRRFKLDTWQVIGLIIAADITLLAGVEYFVLAMLLVIIPVLVVCILNRRNSFRSRNPWWDKAYAKLRKLLVPYVIAVIAVVFAMGIRAAAPRYFSYDGDIYCNYDGRYYIYENYDYSPANSIPYELEANSNEYRINSSSDYWSPDYSFKDSDCYSEHYSSSDSDYDWSSSDSWDSGSSDFDSDW